MPTRENVPTPTIVINLATVRQNLARMADYCRQHNLRLRPHFKTHKTLFMADLQLAAGASGLTFAKVGEAEVVGPRARDILLAYPALDDERTTRLAALAKEAPTRVAVDSTLAVDRLANAARKIGATIGILVDLDVGFHRTGVQSPEEALALAQYISRTQGVRLDGLMIYPGQIRQAPDHQSADLKQVNEILQATLARLHQKNLPTPIISGGSSPTAFLSHLIPALTEIRPGTYIYNDRNMLITNNCTLDQCAAFIHATVISTAVPNKAVIDAGSKVLSSDRLALNPDTAGHGLILEHPQARITRLSEEHGEIDLAASPTRPTLGDRLTILPNHICPCINLANSVWLHDASHDLAPLPINARGCVI